MTHTYEMYAEVRAKLEANLGGLADILRQQQEESDFQDWYRAWSMVTGLNPNPDDPRHHYDMRRAYQAGATPRLDPTDQRMHWPSQFKALDHPNRFVNGIDTITGQPVQAVPDDPGPNNVTTNIPDGPPQ